MRLKSSLLNNLDNIIYIGNFHDNCCKVYYQDKHYEIYRLTVNKFLKQLNNNQRPIRIYTSSYHSPIQIDNTLFSPTTNIKHNNCEYFNLLKIEEQDEYYESVLASKKILNMARKRYIDYKKKVIFNK